MRLALLVFIALSVAAITLVGCGGDSDEEQIRDAVTAFLDAAEEEDVAKFCDAVVVAGEEPCEDQVSADDFVGSGDVEELEVTEIEINGDAATAQGTATVDGEETTQELSFRKVDGEWKVDFSR